MAWPHASPPLEDHRFSTRTFSVRKSAHRLGGLVFVCSEQIVETFEAESFEEPFSESGGSLSASWISIHRMHETRQQDLVLNSAVVHIDI